MKHNHYRFRDYPHMLNVVIVFSTPNAYALRRPDIVKNKYILYETQRIFVQMVNTCSEVLPRHPTNRPMKFNVHNRKKNCVYSNQIESKLLQQKFQKLNEYGPICTETASDAFYCLYLQYFERFPFHLFDCCVPVLNADENRSAENGSQMKMKQKLNGIRLNGKWSNG